MPEVLEFELCDLEGKKNVKFFEEQEEKCNLKVILKQVNNYYSKYESGFCISIKHQNEVVQNSDGNYVCIETNHFQFHKPDLKTK